MKKWFFILPTALVIPVYILYLQQIEKTPLPAKASVQHAADGVGRAVEDLKDALKEHPLTDHDKAMLNQILSARLQGIMIKIDPQFSEHGSAMHLLISVKTRELGGISSEAGKNFMERAMSLVK